MSTIDPATDYIHAVLRGSGTPVTERPDVAAELRAHIDALVQRHRLDGQAEKGAVAAALREFGDPDVLRQELRRQQMRALRRRRLAEFWPTVAVVAVAMAGLTIWFTANAATGTVLQRVWAGLAFYVALEVASTTLGLLIIWCVPPFELSVPRPEIGLLRRSLGWLAAYSVGLVGIVVMIAALMVVVGALWKPHALHTSDPYCLLRAMLQANAITAVQWVGMGGMVLLAIGTSAVQYLRSPAGHEVETSA